MQRSSLHCCVRPMIHWLMVALSSICLSLHINSLIGWSAHAFLSLPITIGVGENVKCPINQPFGISACSHVGRNVKSGIKHFMAATSSTLPDIDTMRIKELKDELESYGISTVSFLEKSELVLALQKARDQGLTTQKTSASSSNTNNSANSESSSRSSSREERLAKEMEDCGKMKASELRTELESYGISTKSFFEKSEYVKACAEARVDGVKSKSTSSSNSNEDGYAEYSNVEVLTEDDVGPVTNKSSGARRDSPAGNPFGGASAGNPFGGASAGNPFGGASAGNPFGAGMGGMGGMGGIADMLKNMGGMGGMGGGSNPFAGGADMMGKAQEMMKNPKVMEIISKAQSNPKIMKAVQECMGNPAAFAKYQNDPEVGELIRELQKYI